MAIAYDSSVDGGSTTGTSLTFAFNNVAGNYLFVAFIGDIAADDITGVTYNGVSMTQVGTSDKAATRYSYLYRLANPATGSHNVVISCSGSHFLAGGAASWSGTNAGALDASGQSTPAIVSSHTSSLTTIADNCWAVFASFGFSNDTTAPAAGTGLTRRGFDASLGTYGFFDSGGVIHPAGSFSGTTTRTSSTYTMFHVMASIAQAAGGISGTFYNANGPGTITVTGASETVNVDNGRGTVTVTGSAGTFNADGGVGKFIIA